MSEKAEFRALREKLGLTQGDVAHALNVDIRSVKRWENPNYSENKVPRYALTYLDRMDDLFTYQIEELLKAFYANNNGSGKAAVAIYRDAEHCKERCTNDIPYGMVNAMSYELARRLEADGIEVKFYYPGFTGEMVEVLETIDFKKKDEGEMSDEKFHVSINVQLVDDSEDVIEEEAAMVWDFKEASEAREMYDSIDLEAMANDEKFSSAYGVSKDLYTEANGVHDSMIYEEIKF